MPGLSFLAKKSWHTSNMDNVERVWLAETEVQKEKKRTEELQKQILEERQINELRRLQFKNSVGAVGAVDTTLDWMYEGPGSQAQAQQTSEEYLLGKIFQDKRKEESYTPTTSPNTGALWTKRMNSKNDTFTRVNEDPMLAMKRAEKKARDDILLNPVKMARMCHDVQRDVGITKEQTEAKKGGVSPYVSVPDS